VRHPWVAGREAALRVTGDVPLAALASAAGLDQPVEGTARIDARITGAAADPRIEGSVRSPRLGLAATEARDVSIEGRWADQTLGLRDIQARVGAGRLRGRLEAAPAAGGGTRVALDLPEVVLPGALADLGPGRVAAHG